MADELDSTKAQVDDLKRQNQMLEKRLQEAHLGTKHLNIKFLMVANPLLRLRARR